MVGTNLKAETFSLMDRRASLEAEMDAIIAGLTAPGGPGITGGLVDAEGFPREGIDIPAVRAQRRRLAELRNDYKDLTAKVEQNLQVLHSAKLATTSLQPKISAISIHGGASQASPMDMDINVKIPFVMVDEITDGSPAAEDGLQLGDQIIKFGSVEFGEGALSKLASEVQSNQGNQLPLTIMRRGSLVDLTITPRRWHGRGLLGCHFQTL